MGQYWNIVNIDKQEESGHLGKLGEFFNDGRTNKWAGGMLRPLHALPPMPWLPRHNGEKYSALQDKRATLLSLPPELLHAISTHVTSLDDLISLAATCHLLWAILTPFISAWSAQATWAGCRIICLGDYMYDLPAGVLSDAEITQLVECGTQHSHSDGYDSGPDEEPEPATLYEYADQHYHRSIGARRRLHNIVWQRNVCDAPQVAVRNMCLVFDLRSGEPLVLRNLCKKLYVRSGAVDALNEQLLAHEVDDYEGFRCENADDGYCLGDALICQICWSSSRSCAMADPPDDLTRGPWAGDRFDLITQDEFSKKADHDEWRDASEDVCEVLRGCWSK